MDKAERQESNGSGGDYRAFLLRCWREQVNGGYTWRFSLIPAGEDEAKKGFSSLDELVSYLHEALEKKL